ncbi:MAG: hypothetical protein JO255_06040 [Alphaproteobacteria bacterium]|nr:hypothetical protein [Alphaproteobacteria bacterium]
MMDTFILIAILVIVFGPRALPVISPAATRSPTVYFVFGSLQIALGLFLYFLLARKGYMLPWSLLVSLYGAHYLWRGRALQRSAQSAIPQSGGRSGGGVFP